jgi:hypothetical protein
MTLSLIDIRGGIARKLGYNWALMESLIYINAPVFALAG